MIYDQFQEKAIHYIKNDTSLVVSAPTGAGKTVLAEYVITTCLSNKKRVVYTAPIKALSNQKYRDFREQFADKIGIVTGDVSINPCAPVLIMTTEIFRNQILEGRRELEHYSWIIFDEIHYLDDYERGTVWEESLIFLPKHMKILALSATIPNIDEFANWIRAIHGRALEVVKEDKRPVPLHRFYQYQGKIVDEISKIKGIGYGKSGGGYHYRGRGAYIRDMHEHLKQNRPTALVKHLYENDMLPCIYFSFGRRRCEYLAEEMMHFDLLSASEKNETINLYNRLCERFGLTGEKSAQILKPLIERGIAYHHAGMLPTLKEVIEQLFTSRLIKIIFTTETFALGINMPARTVVLDELRKFYGRFHAALKTRDFYQMAGRAGRRGIDKEGFVYSRVNPHGMDFQELHRIIYGKPEEVRSKFNCSYATLLNLYEKYGEKLYDIYRRSFHYFQEKKESRNKALNLMYAKVKILKELGYIRKNEITEKGNFASKIFGYELSLSELYGTGAFERLSEIEIATLCLALVFEPRKASRMGQLTRKTKALNALTEETLYRIHKMERKLGITPLSKKYFYHLSPALEAWLRNERFDRILRYTDVDEGEIIRYFRMTVQIFREILDTPASPELKGRIKNLTYLVNRGIIDAEKQLGL